MPLHIKHVGRIDWNELDIFVQIFGSSQEVADWHALTRVFRDSRYLEELHDALINEGFTTVVDLSVDDVCLLVRAGYLVEFHGDIGAQATSFSVVEMTKSRRRWILHPILLNATPEIPHNVRFPRPHEVAEKIAQFRFARTYDFAWYFGHFPIPLAIARFFALVTSYGAFVPFE